MRPVLSFIEKPDGAAAADLIRAGSAWSTGIFAGRISQILGLYPRHLDELILNLKTIVASWRDPRVPSAELASLYARHRSIDFSHDVLQKHPDRLQFLTVPPCGWSDVGTPSRLATALWSLRSLNRDRRSSPMSARAFNLASVFDRDACGSKVLSEVALPMSNMDSRRIPSDASSNP
jgi:mannose-1-phosphate guanylyltransferase